MVVLISSYTNCKHPECCHFNLKAVIICEGFPKLYIIEDFDVGCRHGIYARQYTCV